MKPIIHMLMVRSQDVNPSLFDQLKALGSLEPEALRVQALPVVSAWRARKIEALNARFLSEGGAAALIKGLSDVQDEIIAALFKLFMPSGSGLAVIATGGYGRAEMFPYSDIDLLFLYRPAARPFAEILARAMLYILWDLSLKVGHGLRTLEETLESAKEDITIRTNLLDARLVTGDAALFSQMAGRFQEEVIAPTKDAFVEAKLAERGERHRRFGNSRYLLEPNLKESKGGLRDLHTVHWLSRYVYGVREIGGLVTLGYLTPEEAKAFGKTESFLWEMRAHLHLLAGKAEDRLTFDRQQAMARAMGFTHASGNRAVERLMKRYFRAAANVGALTRILCALLEEQNRRPPKLPLARRMGNLWKLEGFTLEGERLQVKSEGEFAREPLRMLKLFRVAQKYGYDIHPRALREVVRALPEIDAKIRSDKQAAEIFWEILLAPERVELALKRMNEVGLLGRFVPEFGRIVGLMQFDMYHIYTVDEHTIVAIGILYGICRQNFASEMPLASEIARQVQSLRPLFLAMLCHDIAKGRGGGHSEQGAELTQRIAKRLHATPAESEMASWLVRSHLLLTHMAFKRDVGDAQTVRDFAAAVQSVERLRLLFLLTVSDMRAVGPGVWNAWKAALLRNLYLRTERYLRTGSLSEEREDFVSTEALQAALPGFAPAETEAFLALLTPEMRENLDVGALSRIARLLRRAAQEYQPLTLDAQHDTARGISEILVATPDSHALFSKLAGAISLVGGNIAGARIFTLKNGLAVDIFQVQDVEGKAFDRADRLARLAVKMQQAISGEIDLEKELAKQKPALTARREAFDVSTQIFIENDASNTHSVVEVVGRDRVGFLHDVTRTLSEQGLRIGSAHISTYGAQAVDVFYVKDIFGLKVTHEKKLHQLREALREAIG